VSTPFRTPEVLARRRAGVLLHMTSLPGDYGVLGASARRFMDFMADAGLTLWQVLPVGPTHPDLSPYQSLSAHAGNQDLIDLRELVSAGLLSAGELGDPVGKEKRDRLLGMAFQRFFESDGSGFEDVNHESFRKFEEESQNWIEDYCLFSAIRESQGDLCWQCWPEALRDRDKDALEQFQQSHSNLILRVKFEQFIFHYQWSRMRQYGQERGIALFGDIPIFVALDSADVWANRALFKIDSRGVPTAVAGVPPDYFSSEGQHWGNPLYDWRAMADDGYRWWVSRLQTQQRHFDLIRIDHFRGFVAFWEIPEGSASPAQGHWTSGPADEFLQACFVAFDGQLPLVAENLGLIGREVEELRHRFNLPGMAVLQFGFDGSPDNPHLPHNHQKEDLVYTGTHDNDTTLGWYASLDQPTRDYVDQCLGSDMGPMPWPVIASALQSVSALAVVPMQDFLELGSSARFNTPGTNTGNWIWQFSWDDISPDLAPRLFTLMKRYNRIQ